MLAPDADIVCNRAQNHYDPGLVAVSDTQTTVSSDSEAQAKVLRTHQANFKPLHDKMKTLMYFS